MHVCACVCVWSVQKKGFQNGLSTNCKLSIYSHLFYDANVFGLDASVATSSSSTAPHCGIVILPIAGTKIEPMSISNMIMQPASERYRHFFSASSRANAVIMKIEHREDSAIISHHDPLLGMLCGACTALFILAPRLLRLISVGFVVEKKSWRRR